MYTVLKKENVDIESKYISLRDKPNLTDTNLKAEMTRCYNEYAVAVNELTNIKTTIVNVGRVTQEQLNQFNACVDVFSVKSKALFVSMDNVVLFISKNMVDSELNNMQNSSDTNLKELRDKITALERGLEESTLDGVFDAIEKAKLQALFSSLDTEVGDVKEEYTGIYSNTNLSDLVLKETLRSQF